MSFHCCIAACREDLSDGESWSYYFLHDVALALGPAVFYEVEYEWGDQSRFHSADVDLTGLLPSVQHRIWRDDGELRVTLRVRVEVDGRERRLEFEFPKLYRQRNLQAIEALGKEGYQVIQEL